MALVGNDMAQAVTDAIIGTDSSFTPAQKATLVAGWDAICGAIVNYIKANADVVPGTTLTVNVGTVIAPSSGGPCSGAGTLQGTGKIS